MTDPKLTRGEFIISAADATAMAAEFLAARRLQHGDLRMALDVGDVNINPGDEPDDAADDAGDEPDDDKGADKLGDPGKQALDRMKAQRNEARSQLAEFRSLGLTPAQIKALQKPGADADADDKVDVEAIRNEARTAARTEALHERVVDKIEAKARGFADPEDAVAILMRSRKPEDFLDGDAIDVQEIEDALTELLEKKPHLAAAAQGGRRFGGGADGGARKESRPDQLSRAQLQGMSPKDIETARRAGRLNDVLGITPE